MFTPIANIPGGSVVTQGLYRYYDAGRSDSYPGTGTTVYDLSGNGSNATMVGGTTYKNNAVGGYWEMNGSNGTLSYSGFIGAAFTTMVVVAPGTDASKGVWNSDDGAFPGFRGGNGFVNAVYYNSTFGARGLVPILWNGASAATLGSAAQPIAADVQFFGWRFSAFRTSGIDEHSGFYNNTLSGTDTRVYSRSDSSTGTIYVGRDPVLSRYPTARLMAYLHYNRRLEEEEIFNNYSYFQNRFSLFEA